MHYIFYSLSFAFLVVFVRSERILGIFPSPGYSQFILGEKLMIALSRRGHDVTVISPYMPKEKVSNYKTILTDGMVKGPQRDLFPRESEGFLSRIRSVHSLGYKLTEYTLSHPDVQRLLNSNETFDLVIAEQFANEALMGFSPHFNVPIILFTSIGLSELNSHLMGDIRLPSIVPVSKTDYTYHMNFLQRLVNSAVNLCDILYKEFVAYPQQQEYLDRYFQKKMTLKEIIYNASLMLMNSHVVATQPAALTSAVIEIGGFHISPKRLPDNLQRFLNDAIDGAILVSIGTNLNISNLPDVKLKSMMEGFSKLKQKIILKIENNDVIPNKPGNVLTLPWLPQSDILAHPNVVAFITHGGLLSITEAMYYGVPMVGVPVFGDQRMNVARCVQRGIAVHVPLQSMSEHTLFSAIEAVLENPEYQQNSRKLSVIFKDQMVKPLDLAIYWVEYVIRHNGAPHLRNASLDLEWYQLYLIDVAVFILICIFVCYYVMFKCLLQICTRFFSTRCSTKRTKPKRH